MILSLIAAADENNCIGKGNRLPWRLPDDLKRFKAITQGKPVIMGRRTFDSIGYALPDRRNIVLTRRTDWIRPDVEVVHTFAEAIDRVREEEEAFVIGGGSIYEEAMGIAHRIYFTRVHGTFDGDTHFPNIDPKIWKEVKRETHPQDDKHPYAFTFIDYERV